MAGLAPTALVRRHSEFRQDKHRVQCLLAIPRPTAATPHQGGRPWGVCIWSASGIWKAHQCASAGERQRFHSNSEAPSAPPSEPEHFPERFAGVSVLLLLRRESRPYAYRAMASMGPKQKESWGPEPRDG